MVWMVYVLYSNSEGCSIQYPTRAQVIPRSVLENAKGFAIFTVVKAGFVFSARAGSGVVIAKLEDGCELRLKTRDICHS